MFTHKSLYKRTAVQESVCVCVCVGEREGRGGGGADREKGFRK